MSAEKRKPPDNGDAEVERDIRRRRKFSVGEAIGRMGGGDLLKGASPVSRQRQAELQIEHYLERQLHDVESALLAVLQRRVRGSQSILAKHYDEPLAALAVIVEGILTSDESLQSFVTEVDAEWGRIYFERPYFQIEGQPPHPEDPYTHQSVRVSLEQLRETFPSKD